MKKIIYLAVLILLGYTARAQMGIGTATPTPGSLLDVTATDKGVIFTRVALIGRTTWTLTGAATDGMLVYNTATVVGAQAITPGYYFWQASKWTAFSDPSVGTSGGGGIAVGPCGTTLVVDVVSAGGRIWMDRNLGACRAAINRADILAAGNLYQWGRGNDGHEQRNSGTSTIISSTIVPDHGASIVGPAWGPLTLALWNGITGINNPCPSGYRIPTPAEWDAEILSWSSANIFGGFASPLKLTSGGTRVGGAVAIFTDADDASYWSADGLVYTTAYFISPWSAASNNGGGHVHRNVRCIKH